MASELYWFYDIFLLGALLIALYSGAKRGFVRSVVLIVLMVCAFALSWLLSTVGAPVIYENLIREPVLDALGEASEKTNPLNIVSKSVSEGGYGVEMTDPEIESIISQTGDFFTNIAGEIKNNGSSDEESAISTGMENSVTQNMLKALVGDAVSPDTLQDILSKVSGTERNVRNAVDVFLNGDRGRTAETVEQLIIEPAVNMILSGVIWVVSMLILTVIAKTIANAFKGLNKVPIIGPVNVLCGGILGILEGAAVVYLAAQAVKLVCILTSDSLMFLNSQTVYKTYLFKYLYDFEIMSLIK